MISTRTTPKVSVGEGSVLTADPFNFQHVLKVKYLRIYDDDDVGG